jgi:hypothetical protein
MDAVRAEGTGRRLLTVHGVVVGGWVAKEHIRIVLINFQLP